METRLNWNIAVSALRTLEQHKHDMKEATEMNTVVNGVKDMTVFGIVPYYNYLHGGGEAMYTFFFSKYKYCYMTNCFNRMCDSAVV